MMLSRYAMLAGYNAWANTRLFAAAEALGPEPCARPMGGFFGSVMGTLNHLVVADGIWMDRFEARNAPQPALDTILASALPALRPLRAALDRRILDFVAARRPDDLSADISYANSSGRLFRQSLASALDHLFNHQAHHRGQVHGLLTQLGGREAAPSLDLIVFQREVAAA